MSKLFKFFLILFLLFNLLGCSKQEVEKKDSLTINQSLLTVNSTNENIMERLEQFYFNTNRTEGKKKEMDDQVSQQQPQQRDEKPKQDKQKEKIELKKQEEKWKGLINKVEQLFKNWNRYESEKSLPPKQVKQIEKKMNQLTFNIEKQQLLTALFQANELNLDFAMLYRQYYNKELKAVIEEMRVYIRNMIYLSQIKGDNQTRQMENLHKLKMRINKLKDINLKKENKTKVKELEHYIKDMEEIINNRNNSVIKIKGNLILNKLNQLR